VAFPFVAGVVAFLLVAGVVAFLLVAGIVRFPFSARFVKFFFGVGTVAFVLIVDARDVLVGSLEESKESLFQISSNTFKYP
jgi:hypothetical protein